MMRTLFLHPPSYDGFDGGAGARYQMKREVRSFWYPTWLAQPAALVEGSKLIDAPPHRLKFEDIAPELSGRELVVMHTSTPSFKSDLKTAEMIKAVNPDIRIGFIGAKVAVEPEKRSEEHTSELQSHHDLVCRLLLEKKKKKKKIQTNQQKTT